MDRTSQAAAISLAVLGVGGGIVGGTAPTLFPQHQQLVFWIGMVAMVLGLVGALAILLWPRRKEPPQPIRGSMTFDIEGSSGISLQRSKSTAETFARVRDAKDFSARDNEHDPALRSDKKKAPK